MKSIFIFILLLTSYCMAITDSLFVDNFENGDLNWVFTGNWDLVEEGEYQSATHSLTDSPGGNYTAGVSTTATIINPFDISDYENANLSLWCKYDLEIDYDYVHLEISTDNGTTWTSLQSWTGEGVDWHLESIGLRDHIGASNLKIRFRLETDVVNDFDGIYIDDIILTGYKDTPSDDTVIMYHPPSFYEGSIDEFTDSLYVYDPSGVSNVEVVYSVDGVSQTNVTASNFSGDDWEFSIPAQNSGSVIEYTFYAVDALGTDTLSINVYSVIAGDHQIYDSGIVSYYNTTENGNAKVVRVTVPGTIDSTKFKASLDYLLLRTYADGSGHISDDMTVRVWQDDGTGKPGDEVISPIVVTPEANSLVNPTAMTLIDLRSEALTVYCDFWIGWSSEAGIVYGTQEATDEAGTTAYDRSYDGAYNGDGTWTWSRNTSINYHFRAITGTPIDVTSIEESNMPLTTSLNQNYPNPFNPTTEISYALSQDAQVSIRVYNSNGSIVADLVNASQSIGQHSVVFDASKLANGIFYYSLVANGRVVSTKKMLLLK